MAKTLTFDVVGRDRGAGTMLSALRKQATATAKSVEKLRLAGAGGFTNLRKSTADLKRGLNETADIARKNKESLDELSKGMAVIGGAAVLGVGVAVKTFAEFDSKMSQVKSLSHATAGEMEGLRQAAMKTGKDIGFSASQAADAEIELVKAGVKVKDIMGGGLKGALQLAAAGQIDVAESTEIATIAMTQFGVKGSQVPHVADLLAAGADKALGGVSELGFALKQSGLVASQFGISIEDTIGALSAFANAGLLGQDAGTSFKTMLQRLANPTGKAAGLMEKLGLHAYDAQGNFVGLAKFSGQLHDKLGQLTVAQRNQALSTIFGSDAIRAATVLTKEGTKGIKGWIDAVNDQGFAAEQAAGKMDNLQGDISKLKAAFENDLIKSATGANGALRHVVQGATTLLNVFSAIPGPVLSFGLVLSGLGGGTLLAAAGLVKVATVASDFRDKIGQARIALSAMADRMAASGAIGTKFAAGLKGAAGILTGPWGLAVAGGVAALGYFIAKHAEAKARVEELTHAIEADSGAMGENTRAQVANTLQSTGAFDAAKRLGISLKDVTDAALGNAAAQSRVSQAIRENGTQTLYLSQGQDGVHKATQRLTSDAVKLQGAIGGQNKEVNKAVAKYRQLKEANGGLNQEQIAGASSAANLANATGKVSDAFSDAKDAAEQFKDALSALNDANQTAEQTAIDFKNQIVEMAHELRQGAHTLNINTKAGRDNREALLAGIKAAQDHASAVADQTGSLKKSRDVLIKEREKLIATAVASGISRKAAERYIKSLLKIPKNVDTDVHNNAAAAAAKARAYKKRLDEIPRGIFTKVQVVLQDQNARNKLNAHFGSPQGATGGAVMRGGIRHFAGGGFNGPVVGRGGPTDDLVPAMLSNGEYVIRASTVRKLGIPFFNTLNKLKAKTVLSAGTQQANRMVVELRVPHVAEPKTSAPHAAQPKAPHAAHPKTAAPHPSHMKVAPPAPAKSKVTAPHAAKPKVTAPHASHPKAAAPHAAKARDHVFAAGMDHVEPVKKAKSIKAGIKKAYAGSKEMLRKDGKQIVDGLTKGIDVEAPHAAKASKTTSVKVRAVYKPAKAWLVPAGKDTVHGYQAGISNATPGLVATTKNTGQRTRNVFKASKSWLRGDGKDLITGLRQGAQSESSHLISSVKGIGHALVKAVKKFFGIHSPSRVFMGIGRHLIGGLVKGMLSQSPKNVMNTVFGGYGKEAGQALQWMLDHHKISYAELAEIPSSIFSKLGFGGSYGGGLNFARAQVGKPYIWGGVGPRGYDCSGFMSAIENVIQGKNPYQRRFATASFAGGPRRMAGFVRNLPSPFMIGVRPGSHTAGTLLGTNVESSGSIGPHVGRSARGYNNSMFPLHYGFAGKLGGSGGKRNPVGADKEGKGFDKGGLARGVGYMPKMTIKPERVLSPEVTKTFDRFVGHLKNGRVGGGDTYVTVHVQSGPLTTPAETGKAVVAAIREYQKTTGGQPLQIKVAS